MSLTFGPKKLTVMPPIPSDVVVTVRDTDPPVLAELSQPVSVTDGAITFTVASAGRYTITVNAAGFATQHHVALAPDSLDLSSEGKIRSAIETLWTGLAGTGPDVVRSVTLETGSEPRPEGAEIVIWYDARVDTSESPAQMGAKDLRVIGEPAPAEDTEDPSTPTGLTALAQTETSFEVQWDASTDNVTVAVYEYRLDGGDITAINALDPRLAVFSGKTVDTPYTFEVRARDANDNVSAWAQLVVTLEEEPEEPALPTHSVFATPPGTLVKTVESQPYEHATGFYTYDAGVTAGWKVKGARLYVPNGVTVPSNATISLYVPTSGQAPTLGMSPNAIEEMTGITSNAWNTVNFPSPYTVTPGTPWWLGVRFEDGTWLGVTAFSDGFVAASDGSKLVLSDRVPVSGTVRNYRRVADGATTELTGAERDYWFGIDAIVEEAA